KLGVVQGQLKSRRKVLAEQTPLAFYMGRIFPALIPASRR
ncbi:MAG: hypothetical protein QOE34_243, partial [Verrucomicrobiota bacterium]